MSETIDMITVREFMSETMDKVDKNDLTAIAEKLELKSRFFKEKLSKDSFDQLTGDDLRMVFLQIFSVRRRLDKILEKYNWADFKQSIYHLLHDEADITTRFNDFIDAHNQLDIHLSCELAGELLHFNDPDRYWLWSRWMWDPKAKTGALPLVTTEGFDLMDDHYGKMYLKVGKGVAFVHSVSEAAEFQFIHRTLFGTDVFLSCVYCVYTYTVLRMRMTQEFNKVMPGLPEFSRRLLGVFDKEETVTTE
jgi:hypothetical protein